MIELRKLGTVPENPQAHMLEYFSQLRSDKWQTAEQLQASNAELKQTNEELLKKIAELEAQVAGKDEPAAQE